MNEFKAISWRRLILTMRRPMVIDLRNLFDPADLAERGVEYIPLGRRTIETQKRAAAE
jgi:UDPglucose 6-dehydrogenase